MSAPTIRPARPGDEPGIHEAQMRSIREVCVKDHGPEEIIGWGNRPLGDRWIEQIREGYVWVAEGTAGIQGVAYLRVFPHEGEVRAHIHALYLTPEVLGQGLGRQLLALMLDTARASHATRITLESTLTAHAFYLGHGFAETGPVAHHDISGHPVRAIPMMLLCV